MFVCVPVRYVSMSVFVRTVPNEKELELEMNANFKLASYNKVLDLRLTSRV